MGLVHDHRVAALGDFRLPRLRPRLLLGTCRLLRVGTGNVQQTTQHEGELLQRGNHDPGAVDQGFRELPAVAVDGLDDTLRMLDLIDGVLELTVEHAPIGDHHDAVEALAILVVVQARQAMGEPRDAVGLAAAGGVLDQVVLSRAFLASRRDDLPHRIELMIAREDYGLGGDAPLTTLAVFDLLLPGLDEQKMSNNVEKAVAREHVLPEVAGAVAGGMLRVTGAAFYLARLAAAVERQEMRFGTRKPRRHVDFVRIGREMHQGAGFEAKERRTRVPVLLVLAHRMAPVLAGARILQLTGGYRQTVQREHEIDGVVLARMAEHLPRDREPVLLVERQHLIIETMRGLEGREPEGLAVELEAVPQHVQRALEVELLDQRSEQQRLQPIAVQRAYVGPEPGLGRFEEAVHLHGEQRPLDVPLGVGAALPAARAEQRLLDAEDALGLVAGHQPVPEGRAEVETVVQVIGGDENICIQKVGHQYPTPRLRLSSLNVAMFLRPSIRNVSVNAVRPSRVLTTIARAKRLLTRAPSVR